MEEEPSLPAEVDGEEKPAHRFKEKRKHEIAKTAKQTQKTQLEQQV